MDTTNKKVKTTASKDTPVKVETPKSLWRVFAEEYAKAKSSRSSERK